ncbi:hypothetical protein NM688_g574 [Phlebia brevispora]|uniref:Uncharacterized protein n=1 Tax=Phlebia brevispora TaxID=194682 RepID=A0ACC1TER9_9APHY|nr:hypothetical protein NM688_g574 [Phlebia brevispora]
MPLFIVSETSLQSLSIADLEHVFKQSSFGRYMVTNEIASRHHRMLTTYFADTNAFMATLRSLGAVISGSFALDYILGKEHTLQSDLDIYVPFTNFEAMKTYLKEVEGYNEDAHLARRRAEIARALAERREAAIERMIDNSPEYVSVPLETGIVQVAALNKGNCKVDIIQNQSASSLYAITRFWSTLQMNYICASGYCCAYPQTTFRLEGVVSPHVMLNNMTPHDFVYPLVEKYERRGYDFRFNWYEPEQAGCRENHEHMFCPSRRRSFDDGVSYCGTFGSEDEPPAFNDTRGAFVSEWKVGWQLGGRHEQSDVRFPSPARAWHSVTGQGERRTQYTVGGLV